MRLVRLRFRCRIGLINAAFIELLCKIDSLDLEGRRSRRFREYGVGSLKTGAVKIGAKREVQSHRDNQAKPEPTALFAAGKQSFGLECVQIIELRNSHCYSKINR